MNGPAVRVHADAATLAGGVATALLARLEEAQARGETPHVALTGGSIADVLHRELARLAADCSVDWSRVVFWWGDERFVPAASQERNAAQATESLLRHLPVEPSQVHQMGSSDDFADAEAAAQDYTATMRQHGSGGFEVVLLGLGPDGHIASLFPGRPALDAGDAIAVAVHDSPKPPPDRVTLTLGALNRARAVWFLVAGEEKAGAVARSLAEEGSVSTTPARGVRGESETLWWLDEEAAALLD